MAIVALLEPYYGGSHAAWADGFVAHSRHDLHLLTLPAQSWKWRMQGGAVTMARMLQELPVQPQAIISSDMLDVSLLRALLPPALRQIPLALYFHENQLTYPQNRRQSHGYQYGFINYASMLVADVCWFNSQFHLEEFFAELPRMLKQFGDYNELDRVASLRHKSEVLPLGLELQRFDAYCSPSAPGVRPLILWNHRWEADKNPAAFFKALNTLDDQGYDFDLVLLGENFRQEPHEFADARRRYGDRILHYGYVEDFKDYARWLWRADYVVSTAYQDFFGISIAEALYCRCVPLLAKRLNYPHLLPPDVHKKCLFREGALRGLLAQHLQKNISVDTEALRQQVAQYDWSQMIARYDAAIAALI